MQRDFGYTAVISVEIDLLPDCMLFWCLPVKLESKSIDKHDGSVENYSTPDGKRQR